MRGDEFRAYDKAFVIGGCGVRIDPDGVIMARIGASLSSILDECRALFMTPAFEGNEFPWLEGPEVEGSRKAPYYVEHRNGRGFSYRRYYRGSSRTVKTKLGKDAVLRTPGRYMRAFTCLAKGWRIERVA